MERDPVPYTTVAALADNIRELRKLEARKAGLQAEMIRGCIRTLRTSTEQSVHYRRAEGFIAQGKARKAHIEDQKKAWLYLEYLATALENQAVVSHDNIDQKEPPSCTAE